MSRILLPPTSLAMIRPNGPGRRPNGVTHTLSRVYDKIDELQKQFEIEVFYATFGRSRDHYGIRTECGPRTEFQHWFIQGTLHEVCYRCVPLPLVTFDTPRAWSPEIFQRMFNHDA